MLRGSSGFDRQAAIPAPGAEHDAGGFTDLLQRNGSLGKTFLGRAGNQLVPERTDLFFHLDSIKDE